MVGLEQVEIHSRAYLVRWIQVLAGNTISWSLQPHKKSLNFGIFKHPGGKEGLPIVPLQRSASSPNTPTIPSDPSAPVDVKAKGNGASKIETNSVVQKLENVGMKCVAWNGKCEADKVSVGKYDVVEGEGGMYGLVFDNTFSKTVSKSATFVLMTYPTGAPPKSGHHLHFSQATTNKSTGSLTPHASPALSARADASSESIPTLTTLNTKGVVSDPRPKTAHAKETRSFGGSTFYTGVLLKQRRKHSNHARRFFSLDFTTCTLSYYRNRHSSALRGSVPLALAVVGTNETTREICVDSGAEVWHLKAPNSKEFVGWRDALDRATEAASSMITSSQDHSAGFASLQLVDSVNDFHWTQAETLVGQIAGIRDAVRRLARDTDPRYLPSNSYVNQAAGPLSPAVEKSGYDMAREEEKPEQRVAFWKRKSSSSNVPQNPAAMFRRSISAQLAVPLPSMAPQSQAGRRPSSPMLDAGIDNVHEHILAILQDMDQSVADLSALINESKQHRFTQKPPLSRSGSVASASEDEWFDARDDRLSRSVTRSQLLPLYNDDSKLKQGLSEREVESIEELSDSGSDSEEFEQAEAVSRKATMAENSSGIYPLKAKTMEPLPLAAVQRRSEVKPAKVSPPSLISFFRKNVGKDLSSIAMPVSSNEPTSMLQRVAEELEYSELLDEAAANPDAIQRLLRVAAFAVSPFSNSRAKERAARKPFNPMLGETYELIREDKGYRFIAEKVEHRPVKIACQAEAEKWTFLHTPVPMQKFWGKSAEINTEGRVRVFLHTADSANSPEIYSWNLATSFLRNMIAGEKYIEPVGSMTIVNESTGAKAVASFKAGGMFAGRSEEVHIQVFDGNGSSVAAGLAGKWTSHLNLTDTGQQVWTVGSLVAQPEKRWGFTTFAAELNEITRIEDGHLPPTDSRLRPDQRAYEEGAVDQAEAVKAKLEERQRARRKVMEDHGEEWKPKWFFSSGIDGEEQIWRLKEGAASYWEARARRDWSGVVDVFS